MSNNNANNINGITKILKFIMCSAFLIGAGMGITALSAPLGVWVNAWDFRKGFSLLRFTNNWGDWIALGILVTTITTLVIAAITKNRGKFKFATLGLLGTLFSVLAFYIPESFRPPENTNIPPIHDITTDTSNPVEFVKILSLRGENTNTVVYGGSPNMTPEKLAALQAEAYPNIQTQIYDDSKDIIFERAVKIAQELKWKIINTDKTNGIIEATDTTFWFRFKDDIVIKISTEGKKTLLNARSLSRVGVSDVGKNAARLQDFFEKMKR
ncbi:MAG: DUF1499 domain-containing protein [Cellvibrionaceae bacterium]